MRRFLTATSAAGLEEVIYCPMCNFGVHGRLEDVEVQRGWMRERVDAVRRVEDAMGVLLE